MEQTERIKTMEQHLTEGTEVLQEFSEALDRFRAIQPKIAELSAYYGSEIWRQDLADDEAGKLPADLKRGVLSEDLVYDLLTENRALAVRMLETAAAILKTQ